MEATLNKVNEYKLDVVRKAELLISEGIPRKIVELNEILTTTKFADRDLTHINQTLTVPVPFGIGDAVATERVLSNRHICELYDMAKPYVRMLIEDSNLLKMWLSFMIPKVDGGNNFGVSIQTDLLHEFRAIEAETILTYQRFTNYFLARSDLIVLVTKYPFVDDYRRAVQDLDEREFHFLWITVTEVRNRFVWLISVVNDNMDLLEKPRASHETSMY